MTRDLAALLMIVILLAAGQAQAAVLTLDELSGSGVPIGNYGGFSWSTYFYHLDGSYQAYQGTGYEHGRKSAATTSPTTPGRTWLR